MFPFELLDVVKKGVFYHFHGGAAGVLDFSGDFVVPDELFADFELF